MDLKLPKHKSKSKFVMDEVDVEDKEEAKKPVKIVKPIEEDEATAQNKNDLVKLVTEPPEEDEQKD